MALPGNNSKKQSRRHKLRVEHLETRRMLATVCSDVRDEWTVGLVDCADGAYGEGFTLLTANGNSDTHLIDGDGREVHSWTGGPSGFRLGARLMPDGSLLSSGLATGPITGAGGGGRLWIQDWEGNVTWNWVYSDAQVRQHHDVEVLPNGNILAIAWVAVSRDDTIAAGRDPAGLDPEGIWSEQIIEVRPTGPTTGEIVWQWNAIDHVIQDFDSSVENFGVVADHPELINMNFGDTNSRDWLHFNGMDYNEEFDQIMVSVPRFGEVWIIDHSTTTAEAASHSGGTSGKGGDLLYRWGNSQAYDRPEAGGVSLGQFHDPKWIEDGRPGAGNITLYHNGPPGATVELIEFAPPVDAAGNYTIDAGLPYAPTEPTWVQGTTIVQPIIGGVQRLPNGNTTATFGVAGRTVEFTPDGEVVWDYFNPTGGPDPQGEETGNIIFKANRYEADFVGFAGRDISPKGYVENWTVGDYNLNLEVDAEDVDTLCGGVHSGDLAFDVNFDDEIDIQDVNMLVGEAGGLPADANLDGVVDVTDFNIWNENRFTASNLWSNGDFNCDGAVDVTDFNIWNENKFTSVAPVAELQLPEKIKKASRISLVDRVFEFVESRD